MSHVQNANINNIPVKNFAGKEITRVSSADSLYSVLHKVAIITGKAMNQLLLFEGPQSFFKKSRVKWHIFEETPRLWLEALPPTIIKKVGVVVDNSELTVNKAALEAIYLGDFNEDEDGPIVSIGVMFKMPVTEEETKNG